MSWYSGDFFDPSTYNQQYNGPTSYELQQQQYCAPSQPYTPYSNGNFLPTAYECNPPPNVQPFYRPNDFLQSKDNANSNEYEDDEPPLLEELGINFDHIFRKTKSVLNPFTPPDRSILDDVDLAGPLVFCLAFAFSLLLLGKIHFGYIYGIVVLGTVGMYTLLNFMTSSDKPCSGLFVTSVLGYCLLPMVILSFFFICFSSEWFNWNDIRYRFYSLVCYLSLETFHHVLSNDWPTVTCGISVRFILRNLCFINNVLGNDIFLLFFYRVCCG